jgi:acyl-coenzyme A thioesterase PaaI-like protein
MFGKESQCFGCAPEHPIGFRLSFVREGNVLRTEFTPSKQYQGPLGVMHGGLVTALADELAAWAIVAFRGQFGFTASIEAKLLLPVRIEVPLLASATITRDTKRLVDIETVLTQSDKRVYLGKFKFVVLDQAGAEKLMGVTLPPEWASFARGKTE